MSGGGSRGRYGNRVGVGKGLVCPYISAHLFIRAALGKADALHHQLATVFKPADFKVQPLIGQQLLLKCQLRVHCFFAPLLQALVQRDGCLDRQAQVPVVVVFLPGSCVLEKQYVAWVVQPAVIIQITQVIHRVWVAVFVGQAP